MNILGKKEIPEWLEYPPEYLALIDLDLVKLEPWYLLDAGSSKARYEGLRKRFPDRRIFAFAARGDNDDIACWEDGAKGSVAIIHDFAPAHWGNRKVFASFWDWFRQAVEDMIEHHS